ncbi:MAG: hypothetical protein WBV65_16075 [Xanthobacteraceae bacterium]
MRRREFITLLSGAATWPLTAHAQQSDRMRFVGILAGSVKASEQPLIEAFQESMQQLGYGPKVEMYALIFALAAAMPDGPASRRLN